MTDRARRWLTHATGGVAIAAAVVLGWTQRNRFAPVEAGTVAPAYAARSLSGDTVALAALRGRVVLLNVWATWCAPCRWEMPALDRLYGALRGEGLEVVAVSVDTAPGGAEALVAPGGAVRAAVEELGVSFPVLLDPAGEVRRRFRITGIPTTFLIDRDGVVIERVVGPARWDERPYAEMVRKVVEG